MNFVQMSRSESVFLSGEFIGVGGNLNLSGIGLFYNAIFHHNDFRKLYGHATQPIEKSTELLFMQVCRKGGRGAPGLVPADEVLLFREKDSKPYWPCHQARESLGKKRKMDADY
jgi:hypothetical protein